LNGVETFEAAIAGASPADEPRLFTEAQSLFRRDIAIARHCETHAYAEAAILLHRKLLPMNGYQLGETAARRGLASTWKRGDAHTLPFDAATPALALLRATAHAVVRQGEADKTCARCNGRGWTITRDGGKRICRHEPDKRAGKPAEPASSTGDHTVDHRAGSDGLSHYSKIPISCITRSGADRSKNG
jgi:hypothetical protein